MQEILTYSETLLPSILGRGSNTKKMTNLEVQKEVVIKTSWLY